MTAATFDHQVGKSLEFFEQQRNEKTACARFIGALYFEARAESRMRLEADTASAQTESRPKPARLDTGKEDQSCRAVVAAVPAAACWETLQPTRLPLQDARTFRLRRRSVALVRRSTSRKWPALSSCSVNPGPSRA